MGDISQIQTGIDIKEIHAQTPSPTLRRHSLSDSLLRSRYMDTEPRTRKNDPIDATQDAAPHHSGRKGNTKRLKNITEHKDEEGIADKTENCSTADESGDGQSTKSEDDLDSGVSFDEDSEKDIDTVEIEEEDWIDYIRRSTADAIDKMEHARIRCWKQNTQKNEMEISIENRNITE